MKLRNLGFTKTALTPKQIKAVAKYRRRLAGKKNITRLIEADKDLGIIQRKATTPKVSKIIDKERSKIYKTTREILS